MQVVGIIVTNRKRKVIAANEEAFRLLSLPLHDVAQLQDFLDHTPQDAPTWVREGKRLRVTRLPLGQNTGTVFVFWDDSCSEDLKRCLEEKNLFSAIINAVPEHIYVKDRNHRFIFVNEADARHHGFASPEEMLGKTDFDLHPEATARSFWEEEEELLRTGKPILNDEREVLDYSTGVQRKIWIATNKVPLRNAHGEIIGMVGVNRDITLQKRTEEALRAAEQEKVLILDALEDQVVYYEEGPKIIWANKATLRNFGLQLGEIVGKYCFAVFEKRDVPCPGCATVQAFATGKPQEAEITSHNGTVWYQRAYPILDEEGKVYRVVTVSSNITAKKQVEERILYLTFHDPLTGLYNRLFFEDALKRLDVPRQLPLSIIMADVNNLKFVNDAFGHAKGDALLQKVAMILTRACRKEDIIARWGGDEFVILLPKTPAAVSQEVIERIRNICVEESKRERTPLPISLALGCATKEKESEDVDTIISEAENRMYRDKLLEAKSSRAALLFSLEQYLREMPGEMETHYERMYILARKMGEALGLSRTELENLHLLVRLHDLGKVAIPRSILVKSDSLTEEEWAEIRKHPEIGYRMARVFPELLPIAESILAHHERFDGQGYPHGLKGKDIPLLARILALVDAFVAMTSDRPCRKALPRTKALEEIRKNAGTQFDPDLVQVFLGIFEKQDETPSHSTY
ncbi:MAG: diguanylate cyclase [Candidatus Caldatribacterium sp.]|nr:diguanylate cyclase [Candidatus Caldatribacterium sp.]